MKKIYLLFILIIVFSACHKDSITFEDGEIIDSPKKIEWPFVYGQIESIEGEKASDVMVKVYQNDTLLGVVYSDSDGKYSTHTIETESYNPITIEYEKNEYINKYRRFYLSGNIALERNIIIGIEKNEQDISKEEFSLPNPSDTNLIKIFGYAKLADGSPVSGVSCEAVWKYWKGNGSYNSLVILKYNQDYTDQDGYFEILVPKNEVIHFSAYKQRYSAFDFCGEWFSDQDPTGTLSQWHFMELGTFNDDFEVILRNDIVFETFSSQIHGIALRCDATPVKKGKIRANIIYKNGLPKTTKIIDEFEFGPNGEFDIYLETCPFDFPGSDISDYSIRVTIDDLDELYSGDTEIDFAEDVDMGQIKLCYDLNQYPAYLNLTLGTENIIFDSGNDNERSGENKLRVEFYKKIGDYRENIFIATDKVQIGEVPIKWLKYWKAKKSGENIFTVYEKPFDEESPDNVILTIAKIEGNYVYGDISGDVDTPNGKKSINASFKIYNK